jgi:hypothetical protein
MEQLNQSDECTIFISPSISPYLFIFIIIRLDLQPFQGLLKRHIGGVGLSWLDGEMVRGITHPFKTSNEVIKTEPDIYSTRHLVCGV